MVQQRVVMSIMGFVSIAVSYAMRACLSVAITEMTEPIKNTNTGNQSTVCGVLHSPTSHANKAANTVSESTEKNTEKVQTTTFEFVGWDPIPLVARRARMDIVIVLHWLRSDAHTWRFASRKVWWKMDTIAWNSYYSCLHHCNAINSSVWFVCVTFVSNHFSLLILWFLKRPFAQRWKYCNEFVNCSAYNYGTCWWHNTSFAKCSNCRLDSRKWTK